MSENKPVANTKSSLLRAMAMPSLLMSASMCIGIAFGMADPLQAQGKYPPAVEPDKQWTPAQKRDFILEHAKDSYCEGSKAELCGTSRPLHKNEIRLLRSVFGDILPFDEVRIGHADDASIGGIDFRGGGFAEDSRVIFDNTPERYSDDYSKKDPQFLIHEFGHLLQKAGLLEYNPNRPAQDSLAMYNYRVAGKKKLSEFTNEQQAQILEDYVGMALNRYPGADCKDCEYSDGTYNSARIRTIRNLVEAAFPKAKTFRLAQGSCNYIAQSAVESKREPCFEYRYAFDGKVRSDFTIRASKIPIAPPKPISPLDVPIPPEPVIIAAIPRQPQKPRIIVTLDTNAPPKP